MHQYFTMMSNRVYHPGELSVIFMINLIYQILNNVSTLNTVTQDQNQHSFAFRAIQVTLFPHSQLLLQKCIFFQLLLLYFIIICLDFIKNSNAPSDVKHWIKDSIDVLMSFLTFLTCTFEVGDFQFLFLLESLVFLSPL